MHDCELARAKARNWQMDPNVCLPLSKRLNHAENPMEQPEPTIAAGKIVDLLTAEISDTELVINLA